MPDKPVLSPVPSTPAPSPWAAWKSTVAGVSLSRFQTIVSTLAGVISVGGALFSLTQFVHPANTGELVAVVQEAGSHRSVTDATVEILGAENTIVATLKPDASGRATHDLKEGVYVVRVSHPRYAAEVRRIQVQPRETVEIHADLHSGSSSPVQRAVNDGVRAVRRAFRF